MPKRKESWIIHDGAVILDASPKFCELFHCELTQVLGKKVEDIIGDHELRQLARMRGKYIMGHKDKEREFVQDYEFVRCDSSKFWGKSHSQRQPDGRYLTWVVLDYEID